MKKHFSIFVLLLVVVVGSVFLLTSCGGNSTSKPKAGEANVIQSGDARYSVKYYTDDGYVMLSGNNAQRMSIDGYRGNVKELNLAKIEDKIQIDGEKINVTDVNGFAYCDTLETVDLSKKETTDIFSISEGAFAGCENLKTVTLPNNLYANNGYSIGNNAFDGCKALTKVNNLDKFSELGSHAFANCKALDNVVLSKDITYINFGLFENCTSLKNITLGTKIKNFGTESFRNTQVSNIDFSSMKELQGFNNDAFYGAKLTKVVLPDNIFSIGEGCFVNNPITEINIPYTHKSNDGSLFYVDNLHKYFGIVFDEYFTADELAGLDDIAKFNKLPKVDITIRKANNIYEYAFEHSDVVDNAININSIKVDFVPTGYYNKFEIIDDKAYIERTPENSVVTPSMYEGQYNLTSCIVDGKETFVAKG